MQRNIFGQFIFATQNGDLEKVEKPLKHPRIDPAADNKLCNTYRARQGHNEIAARYREISSIRSRSTIG